jgi:hypothetical protein
VSFEQQLAAHVAKNKHACLKFFYMESIFPLAELGIMQLYEHHSLSVDELAYDLFSVLRRRTEFQKGIAHFITRMKKLHSTSPMDMPFEELKHQTTIFLGKLHLDLIEFDKYDGDRLPFNTMWFEKPDTVTFFRMELSDV